MRVDLLNHAIPEIREAFQGVSLRSCAGTSTRSSAAFSKGEVICREGEYGATAFLIEKGSVEIFIRTPTRARREPAEAGFFGAIGRFTSRLDRARKTRATRTDARLHPDRRPGRACPTAGLKRRWAPATSSAR